MNSLPNDLKFANASRFKELYMSQVVLPKVRAVIHQLLLSRSDENEVFNIGNFCLENNFDPDQRKLFVNVALPQIERELRELGWQTKVCYYGNALFIHDPSSAPSNITEF